MTDLVKLNRTWLCSVVFLDIVGHGLQSREAQRQRKRRFNRYLAGAIIECPESDRVVLDRHDGATICFFGDPETAMFCALRMMGAVAAETRAKANPLSVRAGINLGPVKLVKDIHGHLNAVGEGINEGRRVMSLAAENQILVARSFYEVASLISESYAGLFKYEGASTGKHAPEHALYTLHPPEAGRTTLGADTGAVVHTASLTAAQIATVESQLAAVVGPIAPHLVRIIIQHSENAAELCKALLAFIPAKSDRKRFLGACRDTLGELFAP